MIKKNKFLKYSFLFFVIAFLFLAVNCFADNSLNWNDSGVYKPRPVLFLHGFAKGNPGDWSPAKTTLGKYFSKYFIYSYLETINFEDSNGSVDTYDSGKLNPRGNSKGWSDKVNDRVNELLVFSKYGAYTTKLNLVCHSMGGLAARWYLAHYFSNYVDKLILIGVPNLGSPLAESANALSKIPKLGWLTLVPVNSVMSFVRDNIDLYTNAFSIDINGEAIDDLDNSPRGSGFIDKLNKVAQSSSINYYGIIGIDGSLVNWALFKDWYGGDSIVSRDSQLGTNSIFLKQSSQVYAIHWREPEIAARETDNKILQFLDSTPPEFTLDSPISNSTTEINTNSISIKGKVYKEYLPADSKLIITGIKQEDGSSLGEFISDLKPSSLWIPNNPDSPVAEFDETIALPGKGTYKISCQIKNPAGLTSDTKVFWVKVIIQSNANIIVHCHNPEGKEIASIQGMGQQSVGIYDGDSLIGYGAYDANTQDKPISISSGSHTIKAKFNGMTMSQDIDIVGGTTQEVTFTFKRTTKTKAELFNYNHVTAYSDSYSTPEGPTSWGMILTNQGEPDPRQPLGETYFYSDITNIYAAGGSISININASCNSVNLTTSYTATATVIPHLPQDLYFRGATFNTRISSGFNRGIGIAIQPFNEWIIQRIRSVQSAPDSVYAMLFPVYADSHSGFEWVLSYGSPGYVLSKISAKKSYDSISVDGTSIEGRADDWDPEKTLSDSRTCQMDINQFGMSSVPYALEDLP